MSVATKLSLILFGMIVAVIIQTGSNFWTLGRCAKAYNVYKCEFTVKPIGISGFKESEVLDPPPEQSK